jgi:uncharacterized protein HemY
VPAAFCHFSQDMSLSESNEIKASRFILEKKWQLLLELGHRWRESENERWEPHFFISVACSNLKLHETAILASLDALLRKRNEETIWINLASIYKEIGNIEMFNSILDDGIKSCTNRTQLLLLFGKELTRKELYSDAFGYFDLAKKEGKSSRDCLEAFNGLAQALTKLGQTDVLLKRIDEFQKEFSEEGKSSA